MVRRVVAFWVVICVLVLSREVSANYMEAHVAGVDARAVIARDGRLVVTHVISYRVLAGTLRSIAVSGFEDDWQFHPTAAVTSSDGHTFGAAVTRDDKDVVHVTVDDPKGLKRGDYRFELVYEGSLAPRRITRDGAFERVRFALPAMHEGLDSARVVLDFPSAPTEPRAATEGDVAADSVTLRRTAERDELELVRPHVAKGEGATFFARVDPKALALVDDPASRTLPSPPVLDAPRERPSIAIAILVMASALALFSAALAKGRLLASHTAHAIGLVPMPSAVNAGLAAIGFGAAVLVETRGHFFAGAALVAGTMPLAAWRVARASRGARGPATWLVVKPKDAFLRSPSRAEWLDATTQRGALSLAASLVVIGVACHLARSAGGAPPYMIAIDAMVLVPIFFTGTSRQLPPSAAREGIALAPVATILSRDDGLKVAPLARIAADGREDEMRLLVSPRLAMPGVAAIEVGVAWERSGGATLASFDVLVRVHDGTFAASKMAAAFPRKRALPGRKPEERVFRFEPEGPSSASAARLVSELADVLHDRRVVIPARSASAESFDGTDRRLPPRPSRKNPLIEGAA